ncbi:hypothetical protein PAMA_020380 [Pampus argenteus]
MEISALITGLSLALGLFELPSALALNGSGDGLNQRTSARVTKSPSVKCKLQGAVHRPAFSMDGDYVIGGVFSIHYYMHTVKHNYTSMPEPLSIDSRELRFSRAMVFAIKEINKSRKLLPGIKLGYQIYDSCASVPVAVRVAFQLSNGLDPFFFTGDKCSHSGMVMAIVGESGSTPSISMSRISGSFNIPQVSHFATCACLSDKQQYPGFFRTVPSDQFQADALAKLVKQFGWTWIASGDMRILLEELSQQPFPPRQWIGSESWVTDPEMLRFSFCAGAVGFGIQQSVIPGLRNFLLDLSPTKVSASPLLTEFWEDAFKCRLRKNAATDESVCNGTEDIQKLQSAYTDTSQLRITNMVYKAVYAIAHAIHDVVCQETNSTSHCEKFTRIESTQVLTQLKKVNFSQNGYHVSFDANGDPVAAYDLVNWQKSNSGSIEMVTVGQYDASLPVGQEIRINRHLTWLEGSTQVPVSVCSDSCPPGTRKVLQKGKPICCYDCIPCPEGEISNATDSPDCFPCPKEFWPNAERDTCFPKPIEFLSFDEVLGIILAAFSIGGACLAIITAAVFFRHRTSPIVRANNSELSFLLLFSLTLCFLCSLTFIGTPSEWSCMLRHTAFGITFVLCISCVLGKTIVVLMAFRATLPEKRKELSLEGGVVEEEIMAERLTGLRIEGVSGVGSSSPQCVRLGDSEALALQSEGDFVIGGLFPLHYMAPEPQHSYNSKPLLTPCSGFDHRAFRWMMTMVFAVQEINRNSSLLPGIELGYRIMDSCDHVHTSLRALFSLVSHSTAVTSEVEHMTETERGLNMPKNSGISTEEVKTMQKTRKKTTLTSAENSGSYIKENVTEERLGTQSESLISCLAGSPVPAVIGLASSSPTRAVAHTLGPFNIPLVSYFATCTCLTDKHVYPSFLRTVPSDLFQVSGLVQLATFLGWRWVGTIGTTDDYSRYGIQAFSNQFKQQGGCLAFHLTISKSPTAAEIKEMADMLQRSTAQVVVVFATEGHLLELLSELAQRNVTGIQWVASEAWVTASLLTSLRFHPLLEGTVGFSFPGVQIPGLKEFLMNVRPSPEPGMEFVNMFWEELFGCSLQFFGDRLKENASGTLDKSDSQSVSPLLHHLKTVNFTTQFEDKVYFDSNGEPVPLYDIINWQKDSNNVPVSQCSAPCPPGSRQARRPGQPHCCFDCLPCADGEISNQTGSTECTKCPEYYWSDKDNVKCIAGIEEFLSFYDTMGIILVALTVLGVVLTTIITTVFHRFRSTPIVKANNSEISFLLLLSLKLCFLCSLVFIGQPSVWTCRLRQAAFGISFVLCLSCLLVKTIVVLSAFRANAPGSRALKLFGPSQQRTLILCTTAPQVCLCTGWLLGAPPFPFRNPNYQALTGKIVVECKEPWPPGFYLVLGYIGLLAFVCLLLAFLGRKLPDTFNEAKLITFKERKELSLEGGVVEEEIMAERLTGLRIEEVSGVFSSLPQCVRLGDSEALDLQSEGDVVIGGLFPLHYMAPEPQHSYNSKPLLTPCSGFDHRAFRWMMTMVFAVQEINRNSSLLPGIELGYRIMDSCDHVHTSLRALFSLVSHSTAVTSEVEHMTETERGLNMPKNIGISTEEVSYFATCTCLTDKHVYPSFLRTVPSDLFQVSGLVQLATFLGWRWVGTIGTTDDYSRYGIQAFSNQFKQQGGCLAFHLTISKSPTAAEIKEMADRLQRSTAQVVVVFASEVQLLELLSELAQRNVTGIQWVASESWVTASVLTSIRYHPLLEGTLGFSFPGVQIPGLKEFLMNVRPSPEPGMEFVNMFWEELFGCSLQFFGDRLKENASGTLDKSDSQSVSPVTILGKTSSINQSFDENSKSAAGKPLLHHLKTVNFTTQFEDKVYFDSNGEPVPLYDIINWQKDSNNVPVSQCTAPCPPGSRQARRPGQPHCCFDCLPCADGEISNQTGSTECTKCPEYYWSDKDNVICIAGVEEFLSFYDTMGIILVALTVLGVVLTTIITTVFHRFHSTPIVKANNSEISFLLLLSLKLCFLCSLVFIGQPSVWTCRLRQAAFGISFVLCLSCLLVKTIVVLSAFRANAPGSRALKLFGPSQQRTLILCTTAPQVGNLWITSI